MGDEGAQDTDLDNKVRESSLIIFTLILFLMSGIGIKSTVNWLFIETKERN